MERDFKKIRWCEINNLKYIEIDKNILRLKDEEIFDFIKSSIESV